MSNFPASLQNYIFRIRTCCQKKKKKIKVLVWQFSGCRNYSGSWGLMTAAYWRTCRELSPNLPHMHTSTHKGRFWEIIAIMMRAGDRGQWITRCDVIWVDLNPLSILHSKRFYSSYSICRRVKQYRSRVLRRPSPPQKAPFTVKSSWIKWCVDQSKACSLPVSEGYAGWVTVALIGLDWWWKPDILLAAVWTFRLVRLMEDKRNSETEWKKHRSVCT